MPPIKAAAEPSREFVEELRKYWSFDNDQIHTHSWHDRENFIARKLPSLLAKFAPAGEIAITDAMAEAGARIAAKQRGHRNCDEEIITDAGKQPVWRFYVEEARAILALYASPSPIPEAPGGSDTALLDWLEEQIVDVIYLDDGRLIDVKGDSVRAVILHALKPQDGGESGR